MFKLNFNEYEEKGGKEKLPVGTHEFTLKKIAPHDTGFDLFLELSPEYFEYKYRVYTHTDSAKKFTNNLFCSFFKHYRISEQADVTALCGRKFRLSLVQGEKYIEHSGYLSPVKKDTVPAQQLISSVASYVPPAIIPAKAVIPPPPVRTPTMVLEVPHSEYRYNNGHTKAELLAAGWTMDDIAELDKDVE